MKWSLFGSPAFRRYTQPRNSEDKEDHGREDSKAQIEALTPIDLNNVIISVEGKPTPFTHVSLYLAGSKVMPPLDASVQCCANGTVNIDLRFKLLEPDNWYREVYRFSK